MKASNLNTKDLMVGDWVKLSKGNWYENRHVELIDIEMVAEGVYLAEPIPITTEILEKNGFDGGEYKNYRGLVFYLHVKGFREIGLTMGYKDNILWCERIKQNYPNSIGDKYAIHHLEYVHELQHALKLCGIEKEIIL